MTSITWLRLYHSIIQDPKILRLTPDNRWYYVGLLVVSSEQTERGTLPNLSEIACYLRVRKPKAERIVETLTAAGLLYKSSSDHVLRINGWDDRQHTGDNTAERMKRYRLRNALRNGSVLDTDTDTDTEGDTEKEKRKESPTPYFGSVANTAELEEPFETGEPEAPPAIKIEPQKPLDPELVKLIEIAEDLFPMAEFGREVQRAAKTSRLKLIEEALKITHQAGKNYWPYTRKVIQTLEQNGWKDPVDAYGYAPKVGEKILPSRTVKVEYYQDPWLSPAPQGATV